MLILINIIIFQMKKCVLYWDELSEVIYNLYLVFYESGHYRKQDVIPENLLKEEKILDS